MRSRPTARVASELTRLAFAMVRSGPLAYGPSLLENALGWVAAGRPSSETTLENEGSPVFLAEEYGTLAVNRSECRPSRARVRLTPTGLRGGRVGQLGELFDCVSPRRVLLRLRATLTIAAALPRREIPENQEGVGERVHGSPRADRPTARVRGRLQLRKGAALYGPGVLSGLSVTAYKRANIPS
jgi:hypothetical protein